MKYLAILDAWQDAFSRAWEEIAAIADTPTAYAAQIERATQIADMIFKQEQAMQPAFEFTLAQAA